VKYPFCISKNAAFFLSDANMRHFLEIFLALERDLLVGGQAVIEGVMMRTPSAYAIACRKSDGSIIHQSHQAERWTDANRLLSLPIIRGAVTLIQSLAIGIKSIEFSARIFQEEDGSESTGPQGLQNFAIVTSMLFAIIFNVALFIIAPLILTNFIFISIGWADSPPSSTSLWQIIQFYLWQVKPNSWFAFNAVDGFIRITIFLLLIFSMSKMNDVNRIFQYHGAEHKTVFTWEKGKELTIENVMPEARQHPRCGTSFLMVVMLIAIVLFSFVRFESVILNLIARLSIMPLIAGISYEIIRYAARAESSWIFKALTRPGLWLQNITTQEPTKDQIEVAILALKEALKLEPSERQYA